MTGPAVLALETASWALIVACASAAISLTGLAWQLTLYRLSGARLSVRLRPVVRNALGNIARGPERGWSSMPAPFSEMNLDEGFVDLAEIRVVNIGRAPVTVSDITLDFGWSKRPWWRHTVGGTPIGMFDAVDAAGAHRLEVGASLTMFVDHTMLIDAVRRDRPEVRAVRASAQGAGKRATRSPWRRRWKLSHTAGHTWPYPAEKSSDIEAFRLIFRTVYPRDVAKVYDAWISLGALYLGDRSITKPSGLEIAEALAEVLEVPPTSTDLIVAGIRLERTFDGPSWFRELVAAAQRSGAPVADPLDGDLPADTDV